MLSLRARIFIVISLIVLFVLGISIFLLVRSKKQSAPIGQKTEDLVEGEPAQTPITTEDLENAAPIAVTDVSNKITVNPATSLELQQKAVQQISKIFVERFSSYSSESQYQNVRDVQSLVSKAYWDILSVNLPAPQVNKNVATSFSSTITKAFSSKLVSFEKDKAVVELQVKITEEKNATVVSRDQQARLFLVKDEENWLVDKFEWVK